MPEIFQQMPQEKTGLVLVTGATGSGKSTTLAAVLNEINLTKAIHIITLEDPVEFVHPHNKSTFNQREMGSDFSTFANGLRAALRQAPKVVLVGEMRDRETVEIGLSAAETGHLVLSTLHTIDAGQTINRILGMFETEEQEQIRAAPGRHACAGSSASGWCPRSAAAATPCWKSWAPTCAPRKPSSRAKAKARAFTKSSRPASPSAGAISTIRAWRPTNRT